MESIEKNIRVNQLLELYGSLLTPKQKEITSNYFEYDLSFQEIAENTNTSRAAVFDLIKRVVAILEEYETKLHLLEKRNKIEKLIENIDKDIKEKIEDLL